MEVSMQSVSEPNRSSEQQSQSRSEYSSEKSESTHFSSKSQKNNKAIDITDNKLAGNSEVSFIQSTGPRQPGTLTAFIIHSNTPALLTKIQLIFAYIKRQGCQLSFKYYTDHQYWTVGVFDFNVVCVFKVFIINTKDPRTAILNPIESTDVAYKVDTKFMLGEFAFFLCISKYIQDLLMDEKGVEGGGEECVDEDFKACLCVIQAGNLIQLLSDGSV
ncbi:hypothetical protein EON65_59230 [archaeon]|nr:MAG: hypothetical protein EON65_59230 [archaeon]